MSRCSAILSIFMLLVVSCHGRLLDTSTPSTSPEGSEPTTTAAPSEPDETLPESNEGFETTFKLSNNVTLRITGPSTRDDVLTSIVGFITKTKRRLADLEKLRSELLEQVSDLEKRIVSRSMKLAREAYVNTAGADTEDSQHNAFRKPFGFDYLKDLIGDYNHKRDNLVARTRQLEFVIFGEYVTFRKQLESLGGAVACDWLENLGQGQLGFGKDSENDRVPPNHTDAQKNAITVPAERIRNNFAKIKEGLPEILPILNQGDSEGILDLESDADDEGELEDDSFEDQEHNEDSR